MAFIGSGALAVGTTAKNLGHADYFNVSTLKVESACIQCAVGSASPIQVLDASDAIMHVIAAGNSFSLSGTTDRRKLMDIAPIKLKVASSTATAHVAAWV